MFAGMLLLPSDMVLRGVLTGVTWRCALNAGNLRLLGPNRDQKSTHRPSNIFGRGVDWPLRRPSSRLSSFELRCDDDARECCAALSKYPFPPCPEPIVGVYVAFPSCTVDRVGVV
jgi:hypothetical protein